MKKMLLFQVGTKPFGIDLARVKSIQSVKHIDGKGVEDGSQSRRAFEDQQSLQYDLVTIFEKETGDRDLENEKLIMVEAEGQSMGMIVSRVDQVVSVDGDMIEPLSPIFKGAAMTCFPNVLKHEHSLILLLAPEGIEKVLQKTINAANAADHQNCTETSCNEEEIISLVNEVSALSNTDPMSLDGHWRQDPVVYEAQASEAYEEIRPPTEDDVIANMIPEIIDTVDIDDETPHESTSFLANLLQTGKDDSAQAEPTDTE